jgi:predicted RNA binding protein YcfA (HicA-like mRNA interferase family)
MKQRILLKHLKKQGCRFLREGKKHTVYFNPELRKVSTIPRHSEISDKLARKICRDLGGPLK